MRWLLALMVVAGCTGKPEPRSAPAEPADAGDPLASLPKARRSRLTESLEPGEPDTAPTKRRPKSILLAEAQELITWRVADGFLARNDVVEAALSAADGRESLRREVERLVDEELAAHRRREREWRFLTDADRLSRAFQALAKKGVIARERFTDCRKCGVAEMELEREDWLERNQRADGYVFYTEQDADGVSRTGELVLEYGSFRDDERADERVGSTVMAALKAAKLEVVAESDDDSSYLVLTDLEWNRRRFTRAPGQ